MKIPTLRALPAPTFAGTFLKQPATRIGLLAMLTLAASGTAHADQFTIFIYESKAGFAARTDKAKAPAYWGSYGAFAKSLTEAGILRGGTALYDGGKAKTVRLRNGKTAAANGSSMPSLGGYFIIEVKDMPTALKWAAKAPLSATGSVEVRPHYVNPMMASKPAG